MSVTASPRSPRTKNPYGSYAFLTPAATRGTNQREGSPPIAKRVANPQSFGQLLPALLLKRNNSDTSSVNTTSQPKITISGSLSARTHSHTHSHSSADSEYLTPSKKRQLSLTGADIVSTHRRELLLKRVGAFPRVALLPKSNPGHCERCWRYKPHDMQRYYDESQQRLRATLQETSPRKTLEPGSVTIPIKKQGNDRVVTLSLQRVKKMYAPSTTIQQTALPDCNCEMCQQQRQTTVRLLPCICVQCVVLGSAHFSQFHRYGHPQPTNWLEIHHAVRSAVLQFLLGTGSSLLEPEYVEQLRGFARKSLPAQLGAEVAVALNRLCGCGVLSVTNLSILHADRMRAISEGKQSPESLKGMSFATLLEAQHNVCQTRFAYVRYLICMWLSHMMSMQQVSSGNVFSCPASALSFAPHQCTCQARVSQSNVDRLMLESGMFERTFEALIAYYWWCHQQRITIVWNITQLIIKLRKGVPVATIPTQSPQTAVTLQPQPPAAMPDLTFLLCYLRLHSVSLFGSHYRASLTDAQTIFFGLLPSHHHPVNPHNAALYQDHEWVYAHIRFIIALIGDLWPETVVPGVSSPNPDAAPSTKLSQAGPPYADPRALVHALQAARQRAASTTLNVVLAFLGHCTLFRDVDKEFSIYQQDVDALLGACCRYCNGRSAVTPDTTEQQRAIYPCRHFTIGALWRILLIFWKLQDANCSFPHWTALLAAVRGHHLQYVAVRPQRKAQMLGIARDYFNYVVRIRAASYGESKQNHPTPNWQLVHVSEETNGGNRVQFSPPQSDRVNTADPSIIMLTDADLDAMIEATGRSFRAYRMLLFNLQYLASPEAVGVHDRNILQPWGWRSGTGFGLAYFRLLLHSWVQRQVWWYYTELRFLYRFFSCVPEETPGEFGGSHCIITRRITHRITIKLLKYLFEIAASPSEIRKIRKYIIRLNRVAAGLEAPTEEEDVSRIDQWEYLLTIVKKYIIRIRRRAVEAPSAPRTPAEPIMPAAAPLQWPEESVIYTLRPHARPQPPPKPVSPTPPPQQSYLIHGRPKPSPPQQPQPPPEPQPQVLHINRAQRIVIPAAPPKPIVKEVVIEQVIELPPEVVTQPEPKSYRIPRRPQPESDDEVEEVRYEVVEKTIIVREPEPEPMREPTPEPEPEPVPEPEVIVIEEAKRRTPTPPPPKVATPVQTPMKIEIQPALPESSPVRLVHAVETRSYLILRQYLYGARCYLLSHRLRNDPEDFTERFAAEVLAEVPQPPNEVEGSTESDVAKAEELVSVMDKWQHDSLYGQGHFDTLSSLIMAVRKHYLIKIHGKAPETLAVEEVVSPNPPVTPTKRYVMHVDETGELAPVTPNDPSESPPVVEKQEFEDMLERVQQTDELYSPGDEGLPPVSAEDRLAVASMLSELSLFSGAAAFLEVSASDFDGLIRSAGPDGLDSLLPLLKRLDDAANRFDDFGGLQAAVRDAIETGMLVARATKAKINAYLASEASLFMVDGKKLQNCTEQQLEQLVLDSGDSELCMRAMTQLCTESRTAASVDGVTRFSRVEDWQDKVSGVARAIREEENAKEAEKEERMDEARGQLMEYLSSPDCSLFAEAHADEFQVNVSDIDLMLTSATTKADELPTIMLKNLMTHLAQFEHQQRRFYTFLQLSHAVETACADLVHEQKANSNGGLKNVDREALAFNVDLVNLNGAHVTIAARDAVAEFLTSRSCVLLLQPEMVLDEAPAVEWDSLVAELVRNNPEFRESNTGRRLLQGGLDGLDGDALTYPFHRLERRRCNLNGVDSLDALVDVLRELRNAKKAVPPESINQLKQLIERERADLFDGPATFAQEPQLTHQLEDLFLAVHGLSYLEKLRAGSLSATEKISTCQGVMARVREAVGNATRKPRSLEEVFKVLIPDGKRFTRDLLQLEFAQKGDQGEAQQQLVNEDSSPEERAVQQAILAYISDAQRCKLFSECLLTPVVTERDLLSISRYTSPFGDRSIPQCLELFDQVGRKFDSVQNLIEALDALCATERAYKFVPGPISKEDAIALSDRLKGCAIAPALRKSVDEFLKELNLSPEIIMKGADYNELVVAAAGPYSLQDRLEEVKTSKAAVSSVSDLITRFKAVSDASAPDANAWANWLKEDQHSEKLFGRANFDSITKQQLGQLFHIAGGSLAMLVRRCRKYLEVKRSFPLGFPDLLDGLKVRAREGYHAPLEARSDIIAYCASGLMSAIPPAGACKMFTQRHTGGKKEMKLTFAPAALDQLLVEASGDVERLLQVLRYIDSTRRTYATPSAPQLATVVHEVIHDWKPTSANDKAMVMHYLLSSKCNFWERKKKKQKTGNAKPDDDFVIDETQLECLIQECQPYDATEEEMVAIQVSLRRRSIGSAAELTQSPSQLTPAEWCLKRLHSLNHLGCSFNGISDLLSMLVAWKALSTDAGPALNERRRVIEYLAQPSTRIFTQQHSSSRLTLSGEEVDMAILRAGGLAALLERLRDYNLRGRTFKTFKELMSALGLPLDVETSTAALIDMHKRGISLRIKKKAKQWAQRARDRLVPLSPSANVKRLA